MKAIEGEGEDAEKLPPISYADKMIVAFAGPFFNLILALALAISVWLIGTPSSASAESTTIGYVAPTLQLDRETSIAGPAFEAGLMPGDRIIQIDGEPVENFQDVAMLIATGSGRDAAGDPQALIRVEREGELLDVEVFPAMATFNERSGRDLRRIGISPAQTLRVGLIKANSPAEAVGLVPGDEITALDGQPLLALETMIDLLNAEPQRTVTLSVQRDGRPLELAVTPDTLPLTKPLLRIASKANPETYFDVIPLYPTAETVDPLSLDSPAQLVIFDQSIDARETLGTRIGDSILGMDSLDTLIREIDAGEGRIEYKNSKQLGQLQASTLSAEIIPPETITLIGFQTRRDFVTIHPTPPKQFTEAATMIARVLGSLLHPQSDIGFKDLNGAVGIGRLVHSFSNPAIFETKWDGFRAALAFAVILNVNLALLNLLPIPVLDGGHMTLATISKLMGRPLPRSMIEAATGVFVMLLFGLMIYITFYDSLDWVGDEERKARELRQRAYQLPLEFPQRD
ncbi:MAG: site-2 protease family protein, partial [Verrucomicrobiota bacterium]